MSTYLLDTSFLIALEAEIAENKPGAALRALSTLRRGSRIFVSPVTIAEVLEGAEDQTAAARELAKYHQTTIGWQAALRCALNQSRSAHRMGENDAWQAALAVANRHILLGRDHAFANRPGLDYLEFTRS